jgi:hypothetical protein
MIAHPIKRKNSQPVLETCWIGTYDADSKMIRHNGTAYTSISAFAMAHIIAVGNVRKSANGWKDCFCSMHGAWVSTYRLGA